MFRNLCFLLASLVVPVFCWADDAVPANPEAKYYKGNLHTHSLWSDGNDFPEMIAEWYRTHGYNFLSLSDHNVMSEGARWKKITKLPRREMYDKYVQRYGDAWVETRGEIKTEGDKQTDNREVLLKPLNEFRSLVEQRGQFMMMTGEEISDRAEGKPIHINATNLKELIQPLDGATVRETMTANFRSIEEQQKKTGREILGHLNHPNFGYAITAEDMAAVLGEQFFEVYNGHPSVGHNGKDNHPSVERLWDIANTIRIAKLTSPPLYGIATDDSHTYHDGSNVTPGRGWVMVKATHLTPGKIISAMKRGELYASSGIVLESVHFDRDSKKLTIEIRPEEDAEYTTQIIGTRQDADLQSQVRTDKNGKPIRATEIYSKDVGEMLAEVKGTSVSYQLTGEELYVRATITSTAAHDNPSFMGQKKQAWTQPVGWRTQLEVLKAAAETAESQAASEEKAAESEESLKDSVTEESSEKASGDSDANDDSAAEEAKTDKP